jgi:trans-2-enoyl-CoA reductase
MFYRNRRIVLEEYGEPSRSANLKSESIPPPGSGELLVKTSFAPVNPADINILEGRYGSLPPLPATIGTEGSGQVIATGPDVTGIRKGDQVLYLSRTDCWQDYVSCTAKQVIRLPGELPEEAACMLKINPATAWLLLHREDGQIPGGWIVQNASNSGVGHAVIAIARKLGIRTVNFVRREELIKPLLEAGGNIVVMDNDEGKNSAMEQIGNSPVELALNAVGGESALRIMSMLSEGATHITYGAMGKRPLKVPNSMLIFKNLKLRGFWLTKWLRTTQQREIENVYRTLCQLMLSGSMQQPVDSVYPPENVSSAIKRATENSRSGKVLLDFKTNASE